MGRRERRGRGGKAGGKVGGDVRLVGGRGGVHEGRSASNKAQGQDSSRGARADSGRRYGCGRGQAVGPK